MLALYHWEPVANSAEALICMAEKGLDFEDHYVDLLAFQQHAPDFLALNPQGQVPVLIHDDRVITETGFLVMYLEEVFPSVALLPASAKDRYQLQVWAKYANEYLTPAVGVLGWHQVMAPRLAGRDWTKAREGLARLPIERQMAWLTALDDSFTEDQLASARRSLGVRVNRLEESLGAGPWLAGPDYSLADIIIFPLATSLPGLVPDLVNPTETPRLLDWLARIKARPAVQQVLAGARTEHPETWFVPGPEGGRWG